MVRSGGPPVRADDPLPPHTKDAMKGQEPVELDGSSLAIDDVAAVARQGRRVALAASSIERMNASRRFVDDLVQNDGPAVYGINTGLGFFSSKRIPAADAAKLSRNFMLSHSVGVGEPFSDEIVRAAMLIRANTLVLGHSGVRPVVVETLLAMLNAGVTPIVPSQGSLGSSGDLAPNCHLSLVFTWDGADEADSGRARWHGETLSGAAAMKKAGIERVVLGAKEGLALSNGTSFSAAIAALAAADSERLLYHAENGTALVFEALLGVTAALDERLHAARRHRGQQDVARRLRELLAGSTLVDSSDRVQDAYSLRCVPQILGPAHDALAFVRGWIEDEINAVTDNPLIFGDGPAMRAISGGNFHGEVLSFAADYLKIAMVEVAALAERQTNRLLHENYSFGLPAMLVARPEDQGLNSGLMMPHYTAVSLVLENQTLAHPDSVHSLPASAGQEDVNANSLNAAKHLRTILENVDQVLAILHFTAAQAVEIRLKQSPKLKLSPMTEKIFQTLRRASPFVDKDRCYEKDLRGICELMKSGSP